MEKDGGRRASNARLAKTYVMSWRLIIKRDMTRLYQWSNARELNSGKCWILTVSYQSLKPIGRAHSPMCSSNAIKLQFGFAKSTTYAMSWRTRRPATFPSRMPGAHSTQWNDFYKS